MNVSVSLDAARALERIGRGHKLPFLAVKAINDTGLAVQREVRAKIRSTYTVRKGDFIDRQVKFLGAKFSTSGVSRWEASVSIGKSKLTGSPLLLPQLETGGVRGGVKGGSVAVPVIGGARPSQPAGIPEALFIQRLALRRPQRGRPKKNAAPIKAGTLVRKGLMGTYQIAGVGIFQHVAGKVARALYLFKPTIRLPRTLGFYVTARRVIRTVYPQAMQRLVNEAFARSR